MKAAGVAAAMLTLALALTLAPSVLLARRETGGVLSVLAAENRVRMASSSDAAENRGQTASSSDAAENNGQTASSSDAAENNGQTASSSDAAETGGKQNKVSNQEELIQALTAGEEDTIVFLSDIVWEGDIWVNVSRTVTVLMGDYNLSVPENNCAGFSGPVTLRGNGGGRPLICADGFIGMYKGARIEAEGVETTALRLGGDSEWELWGTVITARGQRATAIESVGRTDLELTAVRARAWGEESVGIRCRAPLVLKLCSVEAEGEAVSGSGPVTVDCSYVSPMPFRASVIERKAFPVDRLEDNGVCFEAGSSVSVLEELKIYHGGLVYSLSSPQTDDSYYLLADAVWSELPFDLSEPRTHYATITPKVPEWFPITLSVQRVPIHIVDKSKPFLARARDIGNYVDLKYFNRIEKPGELLLEYSTDGGDSWKPAPDTERSYVSAEEAYVGPMDTRWYYWFRLTVTGGPMEGVSNVLLYRPTASSQEAGGDRDHDDRGDQGEEPPHGEIIPPPVDSTENGGSEDGETEDNGTGDSETGDNRTGDSETGDSETGDSETEDSETEDSETGDDEIGDNEAEDSKTGEGGIGDEGTKNGGADAKQEDESKGKTLNPPTEENAKGSDEATSGETTGRDGAGTGGIGKTDGTGPLSTIAAIVGGGAMIVFCIYKKRRKKTDLE